MTDLTEFDADLLRRAATACRNRQTQRGGETEWFDWVAPHLDQLAARITPSPSTEESS